MLAAVRDEQGGHPRMAAPRKYSDAQRLAIYAQHELGFKPAEIARRCGDGLASVEPFTIPRRSVGDIIATISRERGSTSPRSLEDIERAEALREFPEQVLRIVKAEMDRIEAKTKRSVPLTREDLDRLGRMQKLVAELRRLPAIRPPARSTPAAGGTPEEGALTRLAREMEQRETSSPDPTPQSEPIAQPISNGRPVDPLRSILDSDLSAEEKEQRLVEHWTDDSDRTSRTRTGVDRRGPGDRRRSARVERSTRAG